MAGQESILSSLNAEQKAAVSAERGNMLIVAGAGTGKTRVLVSRTAWLLAVDEVPARRILAVTFTNKAAGEMMERIEALNLQGVNMRGLWVGTFHSICARFLRSYAAQAGLTPDFTIIDTDGQKAAVNHILDEPEYADLKQSFAGSRNYQGRIAQWIAVFKEQGLRPEQAAVRYADSLKAPRYGRDDAERKAALKLFAAYEQYCREHFQVDFAELLLRTVELFTENEELRALQHKRFAEILVDEFQDTNTLQYRLIKLLCGPDCCVFAVGDDDQSIYGWRGADYTNLQRFKRDFAPVKIFKLEQNYRSTSQILQAANALIGVNAERLTDKHLVAVHGDGARVDVLHFYNQVSEAAGIVRRIKILHEREGLRYGDIAILYRNNSRSGQLEQALLTAGVEYYVYGGLKFFDRREVQDAVSYLRLAVNPQDDTSFLRTVNQPPRGMGSSKLKEISDLARMRGCSLYEALQLAVKSGLSPSAGPNLRRLAKAAQPYAALIDDLRRGYLSGTGPAALMREVIERSGLLDLYRAADLKEHKDDGSGREANLQELVSNALTLEQREQENPTLDLEGRPFGAVIIFLSNAALMSSADQGTGSGSASFADRVCLYTIHSAKGLEFNTVFVSGFERCVLPSLRADADGGEAFDQDQRMQEERRLAYVAITRAKERLYLCYADRSLIFGRYDYTGPSPFLTEIRDSLSPAELKSTLKEEYAG